MHTIIPSAPWVDYDEYDLPGDLPEGYAGWDGDGCDSVEAMRLCSGELWADEDLWAHRPAGRVPLRKRRSISGEPSDEWGYGPLDETEEQYAARCAADRVGVFLSAGEDVDAEEVLDLGTGRARQIRGLDSALAAEGVAA